MRHLALAWPRDEAAVAADGEFLFGPDLLAAPVVEPGAKERRVYLPRGPLGRLVAQRSVPQGGRLVPRSTCAFCCAASAERTCPRRSEQLPLLARAGSVLPLLPADVDTLAPYGRDLVRLRDRRRHLSLLAFPRGRWSGGMFEGERLRSRETRGGWRLHVSGERRRRYRLEAALGALRHRFVPAQVMLDGRQLPRRAWSFSPRREILRVRFSARRATLVVRAAGRSAPGA